MKRLINSALVFIAIGLAIYAGLFYAAEQLMLRNGHSNPFFKMATVQGPFDWVILGASHAMPLDFADFNALLQSETRQRVLNLASPGTGPLYNRFVLEHFLTRHHARNVLYVVDSFSFYSPAWNEDRFADAKLLRRTPFEPVIAQRLWSYVCYKGVDPHAALDYVTGFSKVNNRERFQRDAWEGEAQFDRVFRPSKTAVAKRIDYLYPDKTPVDARARYLDELSALIALAQRHGIEISVIKMPVPQQFRSQLPDEAAFDAAMAQMLAARGVPFHDLSATIDEPRFYFDTDHLNRAGLTEFLARDLKRIVGRADSEKDRN